MKALATVLIVLGLMLPSYGEAKKILDTVGAVGATCGKWIEVRENKRLYDSSMDDLLKGSVEGFLGGLNIGSGLSTEGQYKVVEIPDPSTILLYVDKSCRDNPLERIWMGLSRLWLKLPNKQKD